MGQASASIQHGQPLKVLVFLVLYGLSILLQGELVAGSPYLLVIAQLQILMSVTLVAATPDAGVYVACAVNAVVGLYWAAQYIVLANPLALPGLLVSLLAIASIAVISLLHRRLRTSQSELARSRKELSLLHEEVAAAERKSAYETNHDELTGLPNTRQLMKRMTDHLSSRGEQKPEAGLALIKIDNIRAINSVFGTKVGDAVVKEAGRRLAISADEHGFWVSRIQSGTFGVFFPKTGEVREKLPRLIEHLQAYSRRGEVGFSLHAVAGYAERDATTNTSGKLFRGAEIALSAATSKTHHAIEIFSQSLGDKAKRRLMIIEELGKALRHGEFRLHYQPQIDTVSGRIVGAEALIRWNNRDLGSVPPDEFIPLAEKNGQIVPIGQWVLEQACRDAHQWPGHWQVSVNVSTVQFFDPAFESRVSETLQRTGFPASRLTLEITESVLIGDERQATEILARLRSSGIAIAMDDFGIGYSSLSYLRKIPLDELKIDRSFLDFESGSDKGQTIIESIVQLSRRLGIRTVSEGVETEEQARLLSQLGCNHIQGYLYGKPMPMDQLLQIRDDLPVGIATGD